MGTVVNLYDNKNGRACHVVNSNEAGFSYIMIEFPEHIGSKYAVFRDESDLATVDVNTLLFQLNAIFMEETTDFEVIAEIAYKMVSFFKGKSINMDARIYEDDGQFTQAVHEFLVYHMTTYMDIIYPQAAH